MKQESRKHITQMSKNEKEYLNSKIKKGKIGLSEVVIFDHAIYRFERRTNMKIDRFLLLKSLAKSNPVEYKIIEENNLIEERVVLRSDITLGNKQIVLVYSLTKKSIVTFWLNDIEDNHTTLNYSAYNANLKIL